MLTTADLTVEKILIKTSPLTLLKGYETAKHHRGSRRRGTKPPNTIAEPVVGVRNPQTPSLDPS